MIVSDSVSTQSAPVYAIPEKKTRTAKVLVWDLDHTLWNGILLEDAVVELRPDVRKILQQLDERGILQSVASRNNHEMAMERLREFGVEHYFLYPHINWGAKSASIKSIAKYLNVGIDAIAFIDDQPFELDEVAQAHPEVLCIDASNLDQLLDMPELKPKYVTEDSRNRRQMYVSDMMRKQAETEYIGPAEEFLASLDMVLTITEAQETDLQRAEELTIRTNQLNTTTRTYTYDELNAFRTSSRHKLLIAELHDKYGGYGKIGLTLLEESEGAMTVKLLLMSCRVMSRGIGSVLLSYIKKIATQRNRRLLAEYSPNDRNRMMYITYKFNGFKEVQQNGPVVILENEQPNAYTFPTYVQLRTPGIVESPDQQVATSQ